MGLTIEKQKQCILDGEATIGIEFGSTRIKAVLIDTHQTPLASGSHDWENQLENGIWTYRLEAIWAGLADCYSKLAAAVQSQYGVNITKLTALGFSGMMHGYMVFDKKGELLVPFRTWRNTITQAAAAELTQEFRYNIPQRWSIAHLYQAILNGEDHVKNIDYITTLAGYIHWKLTGKKVLGVGEASGMFPINVETGFFHEKMLTRFDELIAAKNFPWKIRDILPQVLSAGEEAGTLTPEGARLLDAAGSIQPGVLLCPPEGDAGTGMAATNSVAQRTGNVSAGTSVFAMIVLEKELTKVYPEIDLVTTPDGSLVGMVHCNNGTSDLNAWVNIFKEFAESLGMKVDINELFQTLYQKALAGDEDCGGLMAFNYFSGEHITGFEEGRPLFVRSPKSNFNLANFIRVHLFNALATLKIGLDILFKEEGVKVDEIFGHGGLFKTKGVGQTILSAAINAPVSVMETAEQGGAFGIALLADYCKYKKTGETLGEYLSKQVFADNKGVKLMAGAKDLAGFDAFIKAYQKALPIERAAIDHLKI